MIIRNSLLILAICTSTITLLAQSEKIPQPAQVEASNPSQNINMRNGTVNENDGSLNVNIPIQTISTNGISIPVSLGYKYQGFKTSLPHSAVGTGWTLLAGGSITRKLNGLPDEYFESYIDSVEIVYDIYQYIYDYKRGYLLHDIPDGEFGGMVDYNYYKMMNNKIDMQPDQFYFNLPNGSGQFVMKNPPTSHCTYAELETITIPYTNVKIEVDYELEYNSNPNAVYHDCLVDRGMKLQDIAITDESGHRFIFTVTETQIYGTQTFPTEWKISQVFDQNNRLLVSFHYGETYYTHTTFSYSEGVGYRGWSNQIPGHALDDDGNHMHNAKIVDHDIHTRYLNSIEYSEGRGKIEFLLDDVNPNKPLYKKIQIFNDNVLVNQISLAQSQFNAESLPISGDTYPISFTTLDSIGWNYGNEFLHDFEDEIYFTYRITQASLNGLNLTDYDFWGFHDYNANMGCLLPTQGTGSYTNRRPDFNTISSISIGVLENIQYDQRKYQETIYYERNNYSRTSSNMNYPQLPDPKAFVGGGLRVQSIRIKNRNGNMFKKYYCYRSFENSNYSSGILLNDLNFVIARANAADGQPVYEWSSNNYSNRSNYFSSSVLYTNVEVKVYKSDTVPRFLVPYTGPPPINLAGRIRKYYSSDKVQEVYTGLPKGYNGPLSFDPAVSSYDPYVSRPFEDWKIGHLQRVEYLDSDNNLLLSQSYTYGQTGIKDPKGKGYIYGLGVRYKKAYSNFTIFDYILKPYHIFSEPWGLLSSTDTVFDGNFVRKVISKTYAYDHPKDPSLAGKPSSETVAIDGVKWITRYKYAGDYRFHLPPAVPYAVAIGKLNELGLSSALIETAKFIKNKVNLSYYWLLI